LSEAAKWARSNLPLLRHSKWVGGSPKKLEIYGFASSTSKKGILMLRNPDNGSQSITINAHSTFDTLLDIASSSCKWNIIYSSHEFSFHEGNSGLFTLEPFQVVVLSVIEMKGHYPYA